MFSLRSLFDDIPVVSVIDVGASPIDGLPIYEPLRESGAAKILGFEPSTEQYEKLLEMKLEHSTFLPYAIGDGTEGELKLCRGAGMSSLLEPDMEVLSHFRQLALAGEVIAREPLQTHRLDDIPEAQGMDFIKVDVQGGEMGVFEGAKELLSDAFMIHTEVQFVPFYKDQPLFAEIDQCLRQAGFWFHRFESTQSRVFSPLRIPDDPHAGISQQLWSDAVYVRRFTDFSKLEMSTLLKLALLAHDLYQSYDLCLLALKCIDDQHGTGRHRLYLEECGSVLDGHLTDP